MIAWCGRNLVAPLGRWLEDGLLGATLFILVVSEALSGLAIWDFGEFWVNRAADAVHVGTQQYWAPPEKGQGRVVTILIGDSAYESDFLQSSPLDRKTAATLIRNISGENARATLVVDLDFSPRGDTTAEADQKLLDDELKKLGRRLVLMTPDRVTTHDVAARKLDWVRQLCDAGVRFGSPLISLRYGVVNPRFAPQGTLAATAYRDLAGTPSDPCGLARGLSPELSLLFWETLGYGPEEDKTAGPASTLRPEYFASGNTRVLNTVGEVRGMDALRGADYIVLGGGWGPDDRHLTAAGGEHYGAEVHAARLHSLIHRATEPPFLFTALLGVVLVGGLALPSAQWTLREHFVEFERYRTSRQRLHPEGCRPEGCRPEESGRYFLTATLWLLAFFVLLIFWIALLFLLNTVAVQRFSCRFEISNLVFAFVTGLFVMAPRTYRNALEGNGLAARNNAEKHDGAGPCRVILDRFWCALHAHWRSIVHGWSQLCRLDISGGLANLFGIALSILFFSWAGFVLLRDFF